MTRKRYQGPKNDKERTKLKLINAVGTVIETKGYTGLTATNIAKAAGLSRRAISLYFDTVENLIETYVKGKDYWVAAAGNASALTTDNGAERSKEQLETLLLNQFRYFFDNEEMQKIVLWQISERTDIMYHVCEEREKLSQAFFALADEDETVAGQDLRAIAALLVGGIYHLVLHAKATNSLFCELDINRPEDFERIEKAISLVLQWVYDHRRSVKA